LLRSIVEDRSAIPGLVFTVSFDTAVSLFEELSTTVRCALLTGRHCVVAGARRSMDAVVRALQNGEVDLLIATDLGGEGLNLQTAGYVVHYDQPWNPAILEQRNGRICRIGQQRDRVEAFQLVAIGSRSGCTVLVKKKVNDRFWAAASGGVALSGGTERQKWRLPSRLESGCPQVRLVRRLRGRNLSTAEIAGMLSGRHRVGVERLLERAAREILDAAAVERVVEVLRREKAMIADFDSTI
jgi:superfamily II DNA/RNA helicase